MIWSSNHIFTETPWNTPCLIVPPPKETEVKIVCPQDEEKEGPAFHSPGEWDITIPSLEDKGIISSS